MRKFYITALLLLIILTLPITIWMFKPAEQLNIAIVDKTVPDETYREHLGLTWLLNHLKIREQDGSKYEKEADFFGFRPDEKRNSYKIRPLPDDYSDYDVIYLADTYGIYKADLPWVNREAQPGEEMIYGGLEEDEWKAISDRLDSRRKSLLIAEYNTFASPTEPAVRKKIEQRLGLEWTGWIGRYFHELDSEMNVEIPEWILSNYGRDWNFSGPGLIFVNDKDSQVVVLEEDKQLTDGRVKVSLTKKGTEQFGKSNMASYGYWFDIVKSASGTSVLAEYNIDFTDEGHKTLEKHGIPSSFPAVLASNYGSLESVYFAGDYNDIPQVPYFYQVMGLDKFYRFTERNKDSSYYWSIYMPIMKELLKNFDSASNANELAGHGQ